MADRLMKLYELNEQYHDTKEKMAWLAITFYAAFCIALFTWTTTNKKNAGLIYLIQDRPLSIIIILSVTFLCVLFFICFQYRLKRASVKITSNLEEELIAQNEENPDQLIRIFKFMKEAKTPWWNRSGKPRYFSTEIDIFVFMGVLVFAQVLVILIALGKWPFIVKWFTTCFAG